MVPSHDSGLPVPLCRAGRAPSISAPHCQLPLEPRAQRAASIPAAPFGSGCWQRLPRAVLRVGSMLRAHPCCWGGADGTPSREHWHPLVPKGHSCTDRPRAMARRAQQRGALCRGCCLCPPWELMERLGWGERSSCLGRGSQAVCAGEQLQAAGSSVC